MRRFLTCFTLLLLFVNQIGVRAAEVAPKADMKKRVQEVKDLKWGMFICWSFSTYSGKEWTPGIEDVSYFKATECDTDQWARTAKEAGMGYILFLTKHHDGFCLWDTKTTDRKITNAPLGYDVLAKLKKSCDKYGIKLALYFSESEWRWPDKPDGTRYRRNGGHNPEMKKAQLKELLTQYGPIEYVWCDYAIGDGGLSHEETVNYIKSIQPGCFVGFNFGDQTNADLRIGERGGAGPINDPETAGPYIKKYMKLKQHKYGTKYKVAEFTYPILPPHEGGALWFYSLPKHDNLCHPAEKLFKDYLSAVKHENLFSIDIGPDYNGKIRDIDVKTLMEVKKMIDEHDKKVEEEKSYKLKAPPESVEQWRKLKFGMLVCWDPSCLKGAEMGWSRMGKRTPWKRWKFEGSIPGDEYDNLHKKFNPVKYDANEWVQIAKDAGMKYMVFTTKHHAGFCNFDSKWTNHKVTGTECPYGKDITKMLADACHKGGVLFGVYYSQPDWHHPDYFTKNHDKYIEYLHNQVRELMTNYGKVSMIFFDGLGGKETDWQSKKLITMCRELQPGVMINNRTGVQGDFGTPEQRVGKMQTERPWETCMTICRQWSWRPDDNLKSLKKCIDILVRTVGGDGNLLLSVGPMPDGRIEPRQAERLREIGAWVKKYGEAIYDTRGGPFLPGTWGACTYRGNTIYLFLTDKEASATCLPLIDKKIVSYKVLTGGTAKIETLADEIKVTVKPDDPTEPVAIIKVELNGPASEVKRFRNALWQHLPN